MSAITCPSGLQLEIRGLKGKEMSILQDRNAHRNGTFIDKLLGACVLSVSDPGPYALAEGASVNWDAALLGDKFYTLLAIRSETFGAEYSFKTQCSACRAQYPWALDLTDLPVKTLSKEGIAAFKAGAPLTAKVPSDGKTVKFRFAVGKDERAGVKKKTQDQALISVMQRRIVEIDGVDNVQEYLEEASLSDLTKLLKAFDEQDCGVETSLESECDACGHIEERTLPLGREFWLPN